MTSAAAVCRPNDPLPAHRRRARAACRGRRVPRRPVAAERSRALRAVPTPAGSRSVARSRLFAPKAWSAPARASAGSCPPIPCDSRSVVSAPSRPSWRSRASSPSVGSSGSRSFRAPASVVEECSASTPCSRSPRVNLADGAPFARVTVWCPEQLGARLSRAEVEASPFYELHRRAPRGRDADDRRRRRRSAPTRSCSPSPSGRRCSSASTSRATVQGDPVLVQRARLPRPPHRVLGRAPVTSTPRWRRAASASSNDSNPVRTWSRRAIAQPERVRFGPTARRRRPFVLAPSAHARRHDAALGPAERWGLLGVRTRDGPCHQSVVTSSASTATARSMRAANLRASSPLGREERITEGDRDRCTRRRSALA